MISRALPILLLSFLFFTCALASDYDPIHYNMSLSSDNPSSRVFLYPSGSISIPSGVRGFMTLSVTTALDVEICIQEWVEVVGNLSQNCNLGGYFNVSVNSTSSSTKFIDVLDSLEAEAALGFREDFYEVTRKLSFDYFGNLASQQNFVTSKYQTTFRANTLYYITARFIQPSSNTSTIEVKLYYDDEDPCDDDEIGLTDGTCATVHDVDTHPVTRTFAPNSPQFFSYEVYSLNAQSVSTQFSVSSSAKNSYSNNAYVLGATPSPTLQIFVRRNAAPDLVNGLFDAASNLTVNGTSEFVLSAPMIGTWYYQISNTGQYTASISVAMHIQICKPGFAGPSCNATVIDLTDQDVNNSTWVNGTGGFQYFTVNHTDLIVGTGTEKLNQIAPAIFASFFNFPANDSYLVADSGNPINLITASVPYQTLRNLDMKEVTWNIAVWSNAGQQYYIWANHACANNCTSNNVSRGVCVESTGYCNCNSGYTGLWCYKSGLALVWVILIVIACAIVLAIVTGVPIACYLKGKKRKQYERV